MPTRSTCLGKRNTITWYFPSVSSEQDWDNRSLEEKKPSPPETAGAEESLDPLTLCGNVEIEEQLVPLTPEFLNVPQEKERGTKRSRSTNSPE